MYLSSSGLSHHETILIIVSHSKNCNQTVCSYQICTFKNCFFILGCLYFYKKLVLVCKFLSRMCLAVNRNCIESIDQYGDEWHFLITESSKSALCMPSHLLIFQFLKTKF